MRHKRLLWGLLILIGTVLIVPSVLFRVGRDWLIPLDDDARLHPFQQRRDARERPALPDLLRAIRAHRLAAAESPESPNWFAWLHFSVGEVPDLSLPPTVSGGSVSRIELTWAPLVYRDVNAQVYQLMLAGNSLEREATRTVSVAFADGKSTVVGMSPFEWGFVRQRNNKNKRFYSDFWKQESFGHPVRWQGSVDHIGWNDLVWIFAYPKSSLPSQIEWIFPVEQSQVIYYSISINARGQVAEAIIGFPKSIDNIYSVGMRVQGKPTQLQLRLGESRLEGSYQFSVVAGQTLLKKSD